MTRFHPEVLDRAQLRAMLMGIDAFTKKWPKAAIEISKDVGWPDDNSQDVRSPSSEHVGLQPF